MNLAYLKKIGLIIGVFFLLNSASAQFAEGMSYQAIARDHAGVELANTSVHIRISVLRDSFTGSVEWEEEHRTGTDEFGLFSLVIGEGISTGNGSAIDFASVDWAGSYHFLKIELNWSGTWLDLGTSQLMSVPYAFHAKTAENVDDADAVVGNESITLIQLVDNQLNMVESGNAFVVDMTPLINNGGWDTTGSALHTDLLVGVGTPNPTSCLDVQGSVSYGIESLTGPVTFTLTERQHVLIADITNGNVNLNLPDATTCKGRVYRIKLYESVALGNQAVLTPANSQTIDGYFTYSISYNVTDAPLEIISDGANWWVLSQNTP